MKLEDEISTGWSGTVAPPNEYGAAGCLGDGLANTAGVSAEATSSSPVAKDNLTVSFTEGIDTSEVLSVATGSYYLPLAGHDTTPIYDARISPKERKP
jgi:hypothetical protein